MTLYRSKYSGSFIPLLSDTPAGFSDPGYLKEDLRNEYAYGEGLKPKEDAFTALKWMHSFIDKGTNLMRDYIIVDGVLSRKCLANGKC